jgi:hypothetical protein
MADKKAQTSRVALIGDIVESRRSRDRQALHDRLDDILARVNAEGPVVDPLVITLGDEFQGVYGTLGDALRAAFRIRLLLHPVDVRFGIGRGSVTVLDRQRGIHDGPAYWNARDAIEQAKHRATRAQTRTARTAYVSPDDPPGHADAVQAALDCLDLMIGSMSETSRSILGGLMAGRTQQSIADDLDISPSAVSQQVRGHGLGVALSVMQRLETLP